MTEKRKLFVIKKFVLAKSLAEAIELEAKTPVHEGFVSDNSVEFFLEELKGKSAPALGFKK